LNQNKLDEKESLILTGAVDSNFFIILFESRKIFTSLGEFTFLHTLSDVPMDEGTLGVQEIKLVIETGPGIGDGRCAVNT
jgi:hypothetical protein